MRRNVFVVSISALAFAPFVIFAWTGPTAAPPGNNVAAPINVGNVDQVKNGGLGLNSLVVFGNSLLGGSTGSNAYLNFGTIPGGTPPGSDPSTGYGIRDNAGTLEFKNLAGSWASLQSTIVTLCGSGACGGGGGGSWTTSGNNIYNTNTGNVGIGTANPTSRLYLQGRVNNSGTTFTINERTRNDTDTSFYIAAGGASGDFAVKTNGNVGIGTTNPQARLDVRGGNVAMGYENKVCDINAPDGNLYGCYCSAGKKALGGGCWNKNGFGVPVQTVIQSDGYYCGYGSAPFGVLSISVVCANIQ